MKEILILGKQGQIAWELQVTLASLGNVPAVIPFLLYVLTSNPTDPFSQLQALSF